MQLNLTFALACCVLGQAVALPNTPSKGELTNLADSAGVKVTSICELAQRGKEANGARVRLKAIYTTDLLERSTITDPNCPSVVVAPFDADEQIADADSMQRFDNAVAGKISDHTSRVFSFEISGTYIWRASESPNGAIYIEKVWCFKRMESKGRK